MKMPPRPQTNKLQRMENKTTKIIKVRYIIIIFTFFYLFFFFTKALTTQVTKKKKNQVGLGLSVVFIPQ